MTPAERQDPVFGTDSLRKLEAGCSAKIKPYPKLKADPRVRFKNSQLWREYTRYMWCGPEPDIDVVRLR